MQELLKRGRFKQVRIVQQKLESRSLFKDEFSAKIWEALLFSFIYTLTPTLPDFWLPPRVFFFFFKENIRLK